jgi:hypothetical protein
MQRDALRVPESLVWLEFRMQSCGLRAQESFETSGLGASVVHAREFRGVVSIPRISIGPAGCRINRDYARRGWATKTGVSTQMLMSMTV